MPFLRIKKRIYLFVIMLLMNMLMLIGFDNHKNFFSNTVLFSTHFVRTAIGSVGSFFSNIDITIKTNKSLVKENQQLITEIERYQKQIKSSEVLLYENDILRNLLQFQYSVDYDIIPANIISITQADGGKEFIINSGIRAGLTDGMIICSIYKEKLVLIGKIIKVFPKTAVFESIVRENFSMPIITSLSNQKGVLVGQGHNLTSLKVVFDSIYQSNYVFVGEEVQINEYSTMFPQGIPIGKISNIVTNNDDLLVSAEVELYVLAENIDLALVLVPRMDTIQ